MPQIGAIELWHGYTFTINEKILIDLTNMPRLRYLSLGETNALTQDVLDRSYGIFQHVRSLTLLNIEGPVARSLLPSLKD